MKNLKPQKIAIISDIHDNLENLSRTIEYLNKKQIKIIICCGDITNNETLSFLSKNFFGDIFLVRGNAEIYNEEDINDYLNIFFMGRTGKIKIGEIGVGFCHEKYLIKNIIKDKEIKIIFFGHSHVPGIENSGDVALINPGTLGGVFQKATFAIWNAKLKNIELKLLERL